MPKNSCSLAEKDYLALLSAVRELNKAVTHSELKRVFEKILLPLFESQVMIYVWVDPDWNDHKLIDAIGMAEEDKTPFEEYIKIDPIPLQLFSNARTVAAYDHDLPRSVPRKLIDEFCEKRPHLKVSENSWLKKFRTGLVTMDLPQPNVGLGFHRLEPFDKIWSLRDLRMLELLRPHLLNSIRSVVTMEKLAEFKSISEALANVPNPLCTLTSNMRIIFGNESFMKLLPLKPGEFFPSDSNGQLKTEMARLEDCNEIEDSGNRLVFFTNEDIHYRLQITKLKGLTDMEGNNYLIRFLPAEDEYTRKNHLMVVNGLTDREIEVTSMIISGVDEKGIADNLFISRHTVGTHIKNIYRKFNINSRNELIVAINCFVKK